MTKNVDTVALAAAARKSVRDPARSRKIRTKDGKPPRLELFHSVLSLCSQKVRSVLAEKELPYWSHDMIILCHPEEDGSVTAAENYHPDYVRLRLAGAPGANAAFATGYSGRTSVTTEGFDPCVVPVLVDHEAGRIIVDSREICAYLDSTFPGRAPLLPADPALLARVAEQVKIVDQTPHPAVLYGFHPTRDLRPDMLKQLMVPVYDHKVTALEALIAENADDTALVAAYRAKIQKEKGGKMHTREAKFMEDTFAGIARMIADLDQELAKSSGPWLLGDRFTMADVLWGVSLIRLNYLGFDWTWSSLPRVQAYVKALHARPSLREEAFEASLRSLPPSAYTDAYLAA